MCEIIAGRIEDEGLLPSEMVFSHITSRAVSDIAGFLGMIERFSRPGLKVICMKGPKWQEELAAAAAVILKACRSPWQRSSNGGCPAAAPCGPAGLCIFRRGALALVKPLLSVKERLTGFRW